MTTPGGQLDDERNKGSITTLDVIEKVNTRRRGVRESGQGTSLETSGSSSVFIICGMIEGEGPVSEKLNGSSRRL